MRGGGDIGMGRETRAFIYTHICVYKHIIDATRERERGGKYKKKNLTGRSEYSGQDSNLRSFETGS